MTPPTAYNEHHYQSGDGLSLYYRNYGCSDNVLVCLPGLTRNCKDFESLATHLALRWRVITPDLRGRGQSEWDPVPTRYRPGIYAGDLWKLMDELAIGRFTIIGASLGGWVAMIMASQQGTRMNGVILNDVGPEIPAAAVTRIMQYAGCMPPMRDWESAVRQIRHAYEPALPAMPDDFWTRFAQLSMTKNVDGWFVQDMDPAIADVIRETRFELKTRDLPKPASETAEQDYWDQFRAMSMPCLLLRGASSDVLPADLVRQMKASKADLQTVTVANRGHTPLLDEPEALEAIDDFLDQLIQTT